MTEPTVRDLVVARALDRIPVPDHEPDFWDRLEAQLVPGQAGSEQAAAHLIDGPRPDPTLELAAAVPLVRRRGLAERRRSLLVLTAAAAVLVAVVAVTFRPGRDDAVRTASDTASTGAPTTAPVSGSERHGTTSSALRGPGAATGPTSSALGTSAGAAPLTAASDSATPQGAFATWASAVHDGDRMTALALTGPRTARYEQALGVSADDQVSGWDSAWGDWATATQRRIDVVELGAVDGQRVVGVVLRRPSGGAKYADAYDALPLVLGSDGWKVEPAGFDPSTDGRLELVSPTPGPAGLEDLPSDGVVQVVATGTGEYVLSVDLAEGTHIPVADAEDGTIAWDPPDAALDPGPHLLLVAHVSDTTITVEAVPFTVSG